MKDDLVIDGYYCLAIAIIRGCTVEKAIALYEHRQAWITQDIIDEMREMRKHKTLREMTEIYCMKKPQIIEYVRGKGEKLGSEDDNDGEGTGEQGPLVTDEDDGDWRE